MKRPTSIHTRSTHFHTTPASEIHHIRTVEEHTYPLATLPISALTHVSPTPSTTAPASDFTHSSPSPPVLVSTVTSDGHSTDVQISFSVETRTIAVATLSPTHVPSVPGDTTVTLGPTPTSTSAEYCDKSPIQGGLPFPLPSNFSSLGTYAHIWGIVIGLAGGFSLAVVLSLFFRLIIRGKSSSHAQAGRLGTSSSQSHTFDIESKQCSVYIFQGKNMKTSPLAELGLGVAHALSPRTTQPSATLQMGPQALHTVAIPPQPKPRRAILAPSRTLRCTQVVQSRQLSIITEDGHEARITH